MVKKSQLFSEQVNDQVYALLISLKEKKQTRETDVENACVPLLVYLSMFLFND